MGGGDSGQRRQVAFYRAQRELKILIIEMLKLFIKSRHQRGVIPHTSWSSGTCSHINAHTTQPHEEQMSTDSNFRRTDRRTLKPPVPPPPDNNVV